jgi:hypothetical protein
MRAQDAQLMMVLGGMVPLAAAEITRWSPVRRDAEAVRAADVIASSADALRGEGDRDAPRGTVLAALARGIALGSLLPGGVTFGGQHWCTLPHKGCPSGNVTREEP